MPTETKTSAKARELAEKLFPVSVSGKVRSEAAALIDEALVELREALKACQLQMLQSNNDSEYAQEANQMAIAALAPWEPPQ